MKRKGFAYVVAILILGLLAFMGLFLMQSSTAEYSHASMSVYRTMARQLAESAADESFALLKREFKNKDSNFFKLLMLQASKSGSPGRGEPTGLNPSLLGDFSDLKDKVTQTLILKDYHITKAGFSIEKILPTIKDCRPIPNGVLDNPESYYHPTDRANAFDTAMSKDWYLTLRLDITVSINKRTNSKLEYTVSRDVKLLNMGPIGRNYVLYSINGHYIGGNKTLDEVQKIIYDDMNAPDGGKLFLWNVIQQSRIYIHGPSIIALENPALGLSSDDEYGAFSHNNAISPGITHSYQYSDTFYGLSYYPPERRGLFPPTRFNQAFHSLEHKNDASCNIKGENTIYGGFLPDPNSTFVKNLLKTLQNSLQETYYRGTVKHQNFMPAGPFCRMPWRYTPKSPVHQRPIYAPNQKDIKDEFPDGSNSLTIEHRWDKDNKDVAKSTQILAKIREIKYNFLQNKIKKSDDGFIEFSLSYFNHPNPQNLFQSIGYVFSSMANSVWNVASIPVQAVGNVIGAIKNFFVPDGPDTIDDLTERAVKNSLPTNFKYNYKGIVTHKLNDEREIPKDRKGVWQLNGVYWLDSCQINNSVTYVGTGTIIVSKYNRRRPFVIRGNVLAERDENGKIMGHLNIIYHPYSSKITTFKERMLSIERAVVVEASVYSCYGIKTPDGKIKDFAQLGIYPDKPTNQWAANNKENIFTVSNVIHGNYINLYMNMKEIKGALWVVHPPKNPLYFYEEETPNGKRYRLVQEKLDRDENFRAEYEKLTHEFFMSPKIQHIGSIGGNR